MKTVTETVYFLMCMCCVLFYSNGELKITSIYRLRDDVIPTDYSLKIHIGASAFHFKTFDGEVYIDLVIKDNITEIELHAMNLTILALELVPVINGDEGDEIPIRRIYFDDLIETMTLFFEEELTPGNYLLYIKYTGVLNDGDMYGIYQSVYRDENDKLVPLVATQFQPIFARRAFPCFDEPKFKAAFDLTIEAPLGYTILSNSKEEGTTYLRHTQTRTFRVTPKMSTYLLAFIVAKFDKIPTPSPTFNIWGRPGVTAQMVQQNGYKLLNKFSDYTGINYDDLGLRKMDVAAIPDFAPGAMENWGLITFREMLLLDDGNETSLANKQKILLVLAHELSHSWFGNLVTTRWWSDTWLNEGIATYFQFYIGHEVQPSYHLESQFVSINQQPILPQDAYKTAIALSSRESAINTPMEISTKFSAMSYHKGACIVRMIRNIVGEEKFKEGMRKYLQKNAYGNVGHENLWKVFDRLPDGRKLSDIMNSWITLPGFPLVTVTRNGKSFTFTQEQLRFTNEDTLNNTWVIPITYARKGKPVDLTPVFYLEEVQHTFEIDVEDDEWLIINNLGSGYFRVNYDDATWSNIMESLKTEDFDQISELDRAELVDDLIILARSGKMNYTRLFNLTDYLERETSYYVWITALNNLAFLIQRTAASELGDAIISKMLKNMKEYRKVFSPNSTHTDHVDRLNQVQALTWACHFGDEICVNYSRSEFNIYRKDKVTKPNPDFREFVYCTALRHSKDPADWYFLWDRFLETTSQTEQNNILGALGCSKNDTILHEYLMKTVTESGIRKHDCVTVFKSVINGNPNGVNVGFEFLKKNYREIEMYYKEVSSLPNSFLELADMFTTQQQLSEMKIFLMNRNIPEEFRLTGHQAVEIVTTNLDWLKKHEKELNKIFNITTTGGGNVYLNSIGIIMLTSVALLVAGRL